MVDQYIDLLRGVDTIVPEDEFARRLEEGRPLRVKLGLDPTAHVVHLGWSVVLRKLRQFQEYGHTAVLIVGDFTAQVGDPSDRDSQRKRLSAEEVRGYADSVLEGFKKVLIWDDSLLEVRYNSEWLAKINMEDLLELTSKVTVAQMLERGDFQKRFTGNQPISLMEFMYPLLQGMDSVAIDSDIELGGSDQLWNNMMGRVLQERYGKRGQMVMTMPLLVGTDGEQKMSQSLGNFIGIDDPADEMFAKLMSLPDHLMPQYFRLTTDLPAEEVQAIIAGLEDGSLHPGETKRFLAKSIVTLYYPDAGLSKAPGDATVRPKPVQGRAVAHRAEAVISEAAEIAEAAFDQVFKRHEIPDDVPEFSLPADDPVFLPVLLKEAGLVDSSSDGRRMINQGGVKCDGQVVSDLEIDRRSLVGMVLQVGKRRFIRLI
jgi:tyrosyl-tRNA synthetase